MNDTFHRKNYQSDNNGNNTAMKKDTHSVMNKYNNYDNSSGNYNAYDKNYDKIAESYEF